jgi:hypothetical protein
MVSAVVNETNSTCHLMLAAIKHAQTPQRAQPFFTGKVDKNGIILETEKKQLTQLSRVRQMPRLRKREQRTRKDRGYGNLLSRKVCTSPLLVSP